MVGYFLYVDQTASRFLTQYSHCKITQYGNNEENAAHNVCAAPKIERV